MSSILDMVDPRMHKARASLITSQPFFGCLAMYLELEEDESIGTMATDGKRIIYAPSFLNTISFKETLGVIAHEVLHCAYMHHLRRGNRNFELWNQATDYAINRDLLAAGFVLPKGFLFDKRFHGMGAEAIYGVLLQEKQAKQQAGNQGQSPSQNGAQNQSNNVSKPSQAGQQAGKSGGPGSPDRQAKPSSAKTEPGRQETGSGNTPEPQGQAIAKAGERQAGERQAVPWGTVLDGVPANAPTERAKQEQDWERHTRQAVAVAKAANAGNLPGHLQELVNALDKAQVDWREELRRFIDARSRFDFSWSRPNKRLMQMGFTVPGIVSDGIRKLGVIGDSSKSCSLELWEQFVAEIQAAMDEGAVDEVIVAQADVYVRKVDRFERGDEVKMAVHGRGGTSFRHALAWFEKEHPDIAALVYLTDLECDDYGPEPSFPVIWAGYGIEPALTRLANKVPFGDVIKVVP